MASDAFFPFPDCVKLAAEQGVSGVIQPGGSIKDEEIIEEVNKQGMFMIFTKTRHFASWGIIILLAAVFPANIYLAQTNGAAMNISSSTAWLRLPFQSLFIVIAYWHSKEE